jgi:hypothetical protein
MLNLEMMLNGEKVTLSVGDFVFVSKPKHKDSTHKKSFEGTVVNFHNGFIIVEDKECDCFSIEPDEIESVFEI